MEKTEKTVQELLTEQNELLRHQLAVSQAQYHHNDMKMAADRWDAANPIAKYFFQNPLRR